MSWGLITEVELLRVTKDGVEQKKAESERMEQYVTQMLVSLASQPPRTVDDEPWESYVIRNVNELLEEYREASIALFVIDNIDEKTTFF